MKNNIFENMSISKAFFKLAIPSIFGLLIVSMQMMIDGLFVGRYVGASGLASINLAQPYIQILMSITLMIVLGGAVISTVFLGKKDEIKASEIGFFTLLSNTVIIGVISIISWIFIDEIIKILGADEFLFNMVKAYLLPLVIFSIFNNSIIFTETFVRIGGKPNAVFFSGAIACSINILLDFIFVGKLGFGIEGAAYATIIANFLAALALTPFFFKKRCVIQIIKPKGSGKLLKDILYNGSSEMLTVVSAAIATFLFNRIIMEHLGEIGVSALTIVFYVNNIVNISLFGLAQALQPIISYNLGANRIDKIHQGLKISLITGGLIGFLSFCFMKFGSLSLVKLFTKGNLELTVLANKAVGYFIFAYLISFINIISSSFHTAIEKPMESALIALFRSLIFVGGYLFILPLLFGEVGIWMAIPLAEFTCLFISVILMKKSFKLIEADVLKS